MLLESLDFRQEFLRLNVSDPKLAEKIILDVSRGNNSRSSKGKTLVSHCCMKTCHRLPVISDALLKCAFHFYLIISLRDVLHCVWESHSWVQLSSDEEEEEDEDLSLSPQLVSLGHSLQTCCFTFKYMLRNTYLCSKLWCVSRVHYLWSISLTP